MRHIWSQSTTLTRTMYYDPKVRARVWEELRQAAVEQARAQGYMPLNENSFFVSATPYNVDDDGNTIPAVLDQAAFVRLTIELTCEDADATAR